MSRNVSIVIPIFNEQEILRAKIEELIPQLEAEFDEFEVLLSENGSKDDTKQIARDLATEQPRVRALIDDEIADYGVALINGVNACRFEEVCILELDYLDLGFLRQSHGLLDQFELVIGSKHISPGMDRRPLKRRLFTKGYNAVLRLLFRSPMTETHGLRTFKRSKLDHITNGCVTRAAVYPSEFVIRAWQDPTVRVREIPLSIPLVEIRSARIGATKRLRKTAADLALLRRTLKR